MDLSSLGFREAVQDRAHKIARISKASDLGMQVPNSLIYCFGVSYEGVKHVTDIPGGFGRTSDTDGIH